MPVSAATAMAPAGPRRERPGRHPPLRPPDVSVPAAAGGGLSPGVTFGIVLSGTPARSAADWVTGGAGRTSAAAGSAGRGSDGGCDGNAWVIGAGSQPDAGGAVPSSARSCAVAGRCAGSLARHRWTSGRSSAGTPLVSGGVKTTRYSTMSLGPVPNGP